MEKETIEILSRDYWFKVVDMLQENWALIEANSDSTYTAFFIHEGSGVFDRIDFSTLSEAQRQLSHNGFRRYNEDKEAQKFIVRIDTVLVFILDHSTPYLRKMRQNDSHFQPPWL